MYVLPFFMPMERSCASRSLVSNLLCNRTTAQAQQRGPAIFVKQVRSGFHAGSAEIRLRPVSVGSVAAPRYPNARTSSPPLVGMTTEPLTSVSNSLSKASNIFNHTMVCCFPFMVTPSTICRSRTQCLVPCCLVMSQNNLSAGPPPYPCACLVVLRSFAKKRVKLSEYEEYEQTFNPSRIPKDFVRVPLHHQSAGELLESIVTAGQLRLQNPNFWRRCTTAVVDLANGFRVRELVSIINAYAKAKSKDEALFRCLAKHIACQAADCRASDLAVAVQAYARMAIRHEALFSVLALHIREKLPALSSRGVAMVMWSYGRLGMHHESLFETVMRQIVDTVETYSPLDVTQILSAMSSLMYRHASGLCSLCIQIRTQLKNFSVTELLVCTHALSQLRYCDEELAAALQTFYIQNLRALPLPELPPLLHAMTRLERCSDSSSSFLYRSSVDGSAGEVARSAKASSAAKTAPASCTDTAATVLPNFSTLYRLLTKAIVVHIRFYSLLEIERVRTALAEVDLTDDLLNAAASQVIPFKINTLTTEEKVSLLEVLCRYSSRSCTIAEAAAAAAPTLAAVLQALFPPTVTTYTCTADEASRATGVTPPPAASALSPKAAAPDVLESASFKSSRTNTAQAAGSLQERNPALTDEQGLRCLLALATLPSPEAFYTALEALMFPFTVPTSCAGEEAAVLRPATLLIVHRLFIELFPSEEVFATFLAATRPAFAGTIRCMSTHSDSTSGSSSNDLRAAAIRTTAARTASASPESRTRALDKGPGSRASTTASPVAAETPNEDASVWRVRSAGKSQTCASGLIVPPKKTEKNNKCFSGIIPCASAREGEMPSVGTPSLYSAPPTSVRTSRAATATPKCVSIDSLSPTEDLLPLSSSNCSSSSMSCSLQNSSKAKTVVSPLSSYATGTAVTAASAAVGASSASFERGVDALHDRCLKGGLTADEAFSSGLPTSVTPHPPPCCLTACPDARCPSVCSRSYAAPEATEVVDRLAKTHEEPTSEARDSALKIRQAPPFIERVSETASIKTTSDISISERLHGTTVGNGGETAADRAAADHRAAGQAQADHAEAGKATAGHATARHEAALQPEAGNAAAGQTTGGRRAAGQTAIGTSVQNGVAAPPCRGAIYMPTLGRLTSTVAGGCESGLSEEKAGSMGVAGEKRVAASGAGTLEAAETRSKKEETACFWFSYSTADPTSVLEGASASAVYVSHAQPQGDSEFDQSAHCDKSRSSFASQVSSTAVQRENEDTLHQPTDYFNKEGAQEDLLDSPFFEDWEERVADGQQQRQQEGHEALMQEHRSDARSTPAGAARLAVQGFNYRGSTSVSAFAKGFQDSREDGRENFFSYHAEPLQKKEALRDTEVKHVSSVKDGLHGSQLFLNDERRCSASEECFERAGKEPPRLTTANTGIHGEYRQTQTLLSSTLSRKDSSINRASHVDSESCNSDSRGSTRSNSNGGASEGRASNEDVSSDRRDDYSRCTMSRFNVGRKQSDGSRTSASFSEVPKASVRSVSGGSGSRRISLQGGHTTLPLRPTEAATPASGIGANPSYKRAVLIFGAKQNEQLNSGDALAADVAEGSTVGFLNDSAAGTGRQAATCPSEALCMPRLQSLPLYDSFIGSPIVCPHPPPANLVGRADEEKESESFCSASKVSKVVAGIYSAYIRIPENASPANLVEALTRFPTDPAVGLWLEQLFACGKVYALDAELFPALLLELRNYIKAIDNDGGAPAHRYGGRGLTNNQLFEQLPDSQMARYYYDEVITIIFGESAFLKRQRSTASDGGETYDKEGGESCRKEESESDDLGTEPTLLSRTLRSEAGASARRRLRKQQAAGITTHIAGIADDTGANTLSIYKHLSLSALAVSVVALEEYSVKKEAQKFAAAGACAFVDKLATFSSGVCGGGETFSTSQASALFSESGFGRVQTTRLAPVGNALATPEVRAKQLARLLRTLLKLDVPPPRRLLVALARRAGALSPADFLVAFRLFARVYARKEEDEEIVLHLTRAAALQKWAVKSWRQSAELQRLCDSLGIDVRDAPEEPELSQRAIRANDFAKQSPSIADALADEDVDQSVGPMSSVKGSDVLKMENLLDFQSKTRDENLWTTEAEESESDRV